jgi:hypothetical protein
MIKKLVRIFSLPILLFGLHLVMVFGGIYERFPWLDIPMHVLGGAFIAYSFNLAITYFQERKLLSELNILSRSVFLFALTSTAAVIWEFGEFTIDFFFGTHAQASLAETLLDMFLGILGGTVLIIFLAIVEIKAYVKKDKTPQ